VIAVVLSCAALIGLDALMKSDHSKAVDKYNRDNWVSIEEFNGSKSITGKHEGEDFAYVDNGRFYEGVFVDGVSLGGKTYEEARRALIDVVENKLNDISIVVSVGDASMALGASDFNVKVDVNDILEKAYYHGRESLNDYYANYKSQQALKENPVEYSIEYTCDRGSISKCVDRIAEFVNTEPVEPYITVSQRPSANDDTQVGDDEPVIRDNETIVQTVYADNGKAIAYIYYNPGTNGFVMDRESMVDRIVNAFNNDDYNAVLKADLEETEPEFTPSDVKKTIKLISSYTSEFAHDEKDFNRCRNIQKAAGILNACVVRPGQEISFNKYVGPRTEEGGWLRAHGIVNGREYEDSAGGGICQVSGTLYNALLACGPAKIKITQRQHHSWPSTYVPIGLDATVDTNGPDLKWKNLSKDSLYIFTYADIKKGKMYVYIYGVPEVDGSYYETYAEVVEEKEPEEPIIINQPMWPTGYQKETITARTGYTAKAYLMHYDKDGNLIEQMLLYTDTYFPVQGEITVGTGDPSLPKPKSGSH
jgi:vancomycin resistance protein YoaR